jgi:hypothetical protein
MASTYVNDLRLNEMATGDGSGTWGTTTNTNLELIAEAFSYGTEVITTNADTHTTTIADGATDPGRSLYLKYTGTLDSACTITIGPNTVSKVWIIENGTSGSQNIILSQGSGANITIPAGDTKVVYSDGAGAGAAFFDAFASLSVVDLKVQDDLTVTDDLIVNGDIDLEGNMDVNGSLETDALSLNGTTVTSTAAEINLLDGSSANTVVNSKAVIYGSSGEVAGTLSTAAQPNITSVGTLTALTGGTGDLNWDSGTLFVDSSANNVGIGTSSPTKLLEISDSTTGDAQYLNIHNVGGGSVNDETSIQFQHGGTRRSSRISSTLTSSTTTNLMFSTEAGGSVVERMRITSTGNVGIGDNATAPTALLELNDSADLHFTMNKYGVAGFDIFNKGTAGTEVGNVDAYPLILKTTNTERLRILAGGGLTFNGDTAAANALDDYEEGTFTLTPNTGTFTVQLGKYTKVGGIVTFVLDFTVGTGGASTYSGLPFAPNSTTAWVPYVVDQTFAAGRTYPTMIVGGGGTTIFMRDCGSGQALNGMAVTTGATYHTCFSYTTDS